MSTPENPIEAIKSQATEEQYAALEKVLAVARERYGQNKGFDAVVSFIDYHDLIAGLPWFADDGEAGKELGARLASDLRERGDLIMITIAILQGCRRMPGDVGTLAARIFEQLASDFENEPEYRKPAMYVAATETGFAVSLAIDDRFWTNGWLDAGAKS